MSFLLPAALLGLLLVAGPLIAHALRRGQAAPTAFPAARLVAPQQMSARSQSRFQDKPLLLLRLLLIVGLAVLGASPLFSCSRLSLSRTSGSSVAVALVLDDSASMRARDDEGTSKFSRALEGAQQLVSSARSGDAFSIVLAGKPARIVAPATSELGSLRSTLATLQVTDRPTALHSALQLAETTLSQLPQEDRRLVIFSDLATEEELALPKGAEFPLKTLNTPLRNCAITKATAEQGSVLVQVGCTGASAAAGRRVQLMSEEGEMLAEQELEELVHLAPKTPSDLARATVRLTPTAARGSDQIPEDDSSFLLTSGDQLLVGVRADEDRSGLHTSGSTVLRTALRSLETNARIQPLALLPSSLAELQKFAVLLIDDPAGLTPETAQALEDFVRAGGVAAAFLGPEVRATPLGSDFRPFLDGAPRWSRAADLRLDPNAELGLGPITAGWADLRPGGRAVIGTQVPGRVLARFTDGEPLLVMNNLGRGLLLLSTLPTSVEESDFALRPAFLALLDELLHEAGLRHGAAATECGATWELPPGTHVSGPSGPLEPKQTEKQTETLLFEPAIAGPYRLHSGDQVHLRHAVISAEESILQPRPFPHSEPRAVTTSSSQQVDISREVALSLLLLALAELGGRLLLRSRRPGTPAKRPKLA